MTDARRILAMFSMMPALVGAGCTDPGPLECFVTDEASAAVAVGSPDRCQLVRIQDGPFTDLSAFAALDPSVSVWVENAPSLTTTRGLPELRDVVLGDVPLLTEVSIKARSYVGITVPAARTIDVVFARIVDGDRVNEAHTLTLIGVTTPTVSLRFEDEGPLDRLVVEDVPTDLEVQAVPAIPEVVGLTWARTVPADLAVLQQFGRPTEFANFNFVSVEAQPVIADYVRWLHEESPGTSVGLRDENDNPLELSDIGVTEEE